MVVKHPLPGSLAAQVQSAKNATGTHQANKAARGINQSQSTNSLYKNKDNLNISRAIIDEEPIGGDSGETNPGTNLTTPEDDVDFRILGNGYDVLSNSVGPLETAHCWQQTDIQLLNDQKLSPWDDRYYKFEDVKTRDELATSLFKTSSTTAEASYGGFTSSYESTNRLFESTKSVEEIHTIVGHLDIQFYKANIVDHNSRQLKPSYVTMLVAKNDAEQKRFRSACGDQFVTSATFGRKAFATIQVTHETKDKRKVEESTTNLKAELGSFSAATSSTKRAEIISKYSEYGIYAQIISAGSNELVSKVTGIEGLLNYLQNFETSKAKDLRAFNPTYANYDIPDELAGSYRDDVFANYRPYYAQIVKWSNLDNQVAKRCVMFDKKLQPVRHVQGRDRNAAEFLSEAAFRSEGKDVESLCKVTKTMIKSHIADCANHDDWGKCMAPRDSNCIDEDNTTNACMANPDSLPYWHTKTLERDFNLAQSYCYKPFGSCYEDKTQILRASAQDRLLDVRYGSNPLVGGAFVTREANRVERSSHTIRIINDIPELKTSAEVRRPAYHDGGIYKGTQYLYLLYPTYKPYVF